MASTASNTPHRLIALLPGDGVGPEVTTEAERLLGVINDKRDLGFEFESGLLGGCAIEATGRALPDETIALCERSDAALVGAVGGPQWDMLPPDVNPGPGGLLRLRHEFDLFANLRPAVSYIEDIVKVKRTDIDILLVREAVGGLYFSQPRGRREGPDGTIAFDTMEYTDKQIRRIIHKACQLARGRSGRVATVDKSNVLESSKLWHEVAQEVFQEYPDVEVEHLYVDNCAMQLVLRPHDFDVIVTENMFGDILSDIAAGVVGSLGLLPSASLRDDSWGLYEPVHGAAPDIAGKNVVNPTAAMLSAAMMLHYSFGLHDESDIVAKAVTDTLSSGVRTADVAGPGVAPVSTEQFGESVRERLHKLLEK